MDNNLPKVYASPINKTINNNREYYIGNITEKKEIEPENVPKKINEIFASPHHVYKSSVRMIRNNEEMDEIIIGKNGNNLLTLDGKRIPISEIQKIDRL